MRAEHRRSQLCLLAAAVSASLGAIAAQSAEPPLRSVLKKGDRHLAAVSFFEDSPVSSEPVPVFQRALVPIAADAPLPAFVKDVQPTRLASASTTPVLFPVASYRYV